MKQFDVCENLLTTTRRRAPYLLVLQSDLLEPFEVRLVAPVIHAKGIEPIKRLTPELRVAGARFFVSMIEMVSVRKQLIGRTVGDLRDRRSEIIAAIDLIVTGV